jgi:hypothetical protein
LSETEETSAARIAANHAETERMSLDWCGRRPGGRRFKLSMASVEHVEVSPERHVDALKCRARCSQGLRLLVGLPHHDEAWPRLQLRLLKAPPASPRLWGIENLELGTAQHRDLG